MRCYILLGLLLICLAPLGCATTGPPVKPPPVNAALGDSPLSYDPTNPGHWGQPGDTRLTARCRSSETFAERRKGNWITQWCVVRCDVLSVERGIWPDAELSFICTVRVPTPESGIMLDFELLYPPGRVWIFELDTSSRPARIVGRCVPPKADTGEE